METPSTTPSPLLRRPRSVRGEIGAYLRRMIDDELAPGERLPSERDLAERLGVSRTSLREAMRELEQERVVDRRPGRGTVVLPPSERARRLEDGLADVDREQADVAELRLVVEPRLAGLAARRAGDGDVVRLEQILVASHAGLSPEESLALDVQFHTQVARAAGNPLLVTLSELASSWTEATRRRSHTTREGRRTSVDGHRAILEAVVAHDEDAAVAAMTAHLDDVARLVAAERSRA
ncbi:GntR family transcriptional regulator [Sediminihabitans luteus]|uniref:GntR family transcriptional regulator n=1 Tax=Sediminihabitans luteus TaxID=1138585 RepID=A0A2M9CYE2_9CELL|nr:FadR/GntR family transcriptional regulator [Sediminihabitans luteus]PJJ76951.1 GntR family transcriptional regulator [Sediminihabitans luteus]GII99592.1 GntR family transcriptional regulator [Sediminihabitans luteus]